MKKNDWLILTLLLLSFNGLSQVYDFELQKVYNEARFNKTGLDSISFFVGEESLLHNVFNTLPGEYTIYQLSRVVDASNKNDSIGGSAKELLMLCESEGLITEAYFFPLNWREPPLEMVLQYSKPNIELTESLRVSDLSLKPYIPDAAYTYTLKEGFIRIRRKGN